MYWNFGYVDAAKHTGYIQYEAILPNFIYWEFATTGYRIGPWANTSDPNSGIVMRPWCTIADTGITLLLVPEDVVTAYYSQVTGSFYSEQWAGMLFPCSSADTLPDFTFAIGRYRGLLPGRYINYGNVDETEVDCFGGIQSQGTINFGIFGDVMLKAQFVVFDAGNQRVGMANKDLTT